MEFLTSNVDRKLIKEKKDPATLKSYVFKPGEKAKLVNLLDVDKYLKDGWYDSPALFPGDKESEAQRQARIDKRRDELQAEMETLQKLSKEKLPEEDSDSTEDDSNASEEDISLALPEDSASWGKKKIQSWASDNGYDVDFPKDATKEEMLEQLKSMVG